MHKQKLLKNKIHVLFLGAVGFPLGKASMQRTIMICKSLIERNYDVKVISRKGIHPYSVQLEPKGNYNGINYIYSSGNTHKSKSFIIRNYRKWRGFVNELIIIHKLWKQNKLDVLFVYERYFLNILIYWIISRIYKVVLVQNIVEYRSKTTSRKRFFFMLNDVLFDKYVYYISDAFVLISDFLVKNVQQKVPHKPFVKIPSLADYTMFEGSEKHVTGKNKYFLFCSSTYYLEVIQFVISAFSKIKNRKNVQLYLILHGEKKHLRQINEHVKNQSLDDEIKIFQNLSYEQLIQFYKGSIGLLIPIRDNIQDTARFPNKISEYCAAGVPIITTNHGEIPNYFKDGENALIAEKYDESLFMEKMQYAMDYPQHAGKMGKKGRELGLKTFDYKAYGKETEELISKTL